MPFNRLECCGPIGSSFHGKAFVAKDLSHEITDCGFIVNDENGFGHRRLPRKSDDVLSTVTFVGGLMTPVS